MKSLKDVHESDIQKQGPLHITDLKQAQIS